MHQSPTPHRGSRAGRPPSERTWALGLALTLALVVGACSQDDGATVRDLGAAEEGSGSASASAVAPASTGSAEADGGYAYATDVSQHRLVSDDVCDLKDALEPAEGEPDFDAAEAVYRQGGRSLDGDGNPRTLAGFASASDKSHGLDVHYRNPTPLDDWMSEALAGTGRFDGASVGVRSQAVEKGAQNQILVAWALHELASALDKAAEGDLDPVSGAVHNWDEAWAYYHGANPACAPYATADSRAANFATTGADGATARANEAITEAMAAGRDALVAGDVAGAEEAAAEVRRNLVVTYSQAAIRYAALAAADVDAGDSDQAAEHQVEGLAFFRVVEALVAEQGADVEAILAVLDRSVEPGRGGGGDTVRAALAPAWEALGITDDDIGTLQ